MHETPGEYHATTRALARLVSLLLCFVSTLSNGKKLIVPARPLCSDRAAYVDLALKRCVSINHHERTMPNFAECGEDSKLEGRYCVGLVATDFELGCPPKFLLNNEEKCVRGEAYSPPRLTCPPGYQLVRGRVGVDRTCVKRVFAEPIYQINNEDVQVRCPNGYKVARRGGGNEELSAESKPERKMGIKKNLNNHRKKPVCISHNIVPPQSKETCISRFRWSAKITGCLMVEARESQPQCPWPDTKIGIGRGDWATPEFVYDPSLKQCVASSSPALYPQCSPGWALEGLFKPYCYKKSYSALLYDCDNAEGFSFV